MNPKVSVIIPCFNQGKYIDEAINSVLNSTYKNVEIIVVNDGSTDEFTKSILKSGLWDKTTIHTILNGGVSNARNFAILNSHGKYILPLDADDKIDKNYIEEAVNILEIYPEIKVVCCNVMLFGAKKGKFVLPEFSLETLLARNTMVVSSLFRRSDFDNTLGYNENMRNGLEDWDFWLRLLKTGGDVYKIDKTLFYYRIKKKSRNYLDSSEIKKLRYQIFLNHRELYSQYFFDPTVSEEYGLILGSIEYRLGLLLMMPFRFLQRINKSFFSCHK